LTIRLLKRAIARCSVLLLAISCAACQPPKPPQAINYSQELPPGELALRKLSPDQYPDFSGAVTMFNLPRLDGAIGHSLAYLATPSSQHFFPYQDITHDRAAASLVALKKLIDIELQSPANDGGRRFDSAIRSQFDVYQSIGALDPNTGNYTGDVLFTGYFTPTYDASLTRTGPFQYPLYKRPADLVVDPDGLHAHRHLADGSDVPCYTRRQIETGHAMDGNDWSGCPIAFPLTSSRSRGRQD
jgi:membrane-bound lytic murein transglycosylase A